MKKISSSFRNMTLSLTLISVSAAVILALTYTMTTDRIEAQKLEIQNRARQAVLNGHNDGFAVEIEEDGFGGKFRIMVGFDKNGQILGYEVLEHRETPGLGSHIAKWFKNSEKPGQSIIGRRANGNFKVKKDGGELDGITAATISSRAFLNAVNKAYEQFKNGKNGKD